MRIFYSCVILSLLFLGCSGENNNVAPITQNVQRNVPAGAAGNESLRKVETPTYAYTGDRYRDPFVALSGASMSSLNSSEVVVPNINALTLKGIIIDSEKKMALLTAGGITYILEGNKLYDSKQRLVKEITGQVYSESVIVRNSQHIQKELKLRIE